MVCLFRFKILQTEEDNVSGITKSKKLLQEDNLIPYPAVDGRLVVEDDKTFNRIGALTIGKILMIVHQFLI